LIEWRYHRPSCCYGLRSSHRPRPDSPSSQDSTPQKLESTLFCSTCLKNQHLYTASLAQYDVEIDPKHPEYKELERKYFQYKKNLENRYPQVCEDCEPKVLERMRQAGKTAKTDYLRRLMDKSRANRSVHRNHQISLSGTFESLGKYLWYVGLLGQLLWNFAALAAAMQQEYSKHLGFIDIAPVWAWVAERSVPYNSNSALSNWTRWCLISSFVSVWWNPRFKYLNNGFMNHIKGFDHWYKYQAILLAVRGLFYYLMGAGVLADPAAAPTLAAHMFVFIFVSYVSYNPPLKCFSESSSWQSLPISL
jgi:hypothetical protein